MLIISGRLFLKPGTRDRFLKCCEPSLCMARRAPGCLDFAVSADIIEPDRANVYEAWADAQSLEAFRGSGADDPSFSFIVHADVERHEVSRSGPP
jgi:quinol monooxygenase YgiN